MESFFSGLGKAVGNLFGSPLEFLSGKSCNEVCQSSWDFICYIENFCVANLLKMGLVSILVYLVLLFFYLVYKLGICKCVCWTSCKMVCSCFGCCIHGCEYCCTFFWYNLHRVKRKNRRRRRRIRENLGDTTADEDDVSEEEERVSHHVPELELVKMSSISLSRRRKHYGGSHLRRSLRPKHHHTHIDVSRNFSCQHTHYRRENGNDLIINGVHDIKVATTSKHKRRRRSTRIYR